MPKSDMSFLKTQTGFANLKFRSQSEVMWATYKYLCRCVCVLFFAFLFLVFVYPDIVV